MSRSLTKTTPKRCGCFLSIQNTSVYHIVFLIGENILIWLIAHSKMDTHHLLHDYMKHLKSHHNNIYVYLTILFFIQVAIFAFTNTQFLSLHSGISGLENNVQNYQKQVDGSTEVNNQRFKEMTEIIAMQRQQQETLEKELQIVKLSGDFSSVTSLAVQSVVSIGTEKSLGTGFIVHPDGLIVTNYHVIQDAKKISIVTHDERLLPATLIGKDEKRDLALLRVEVSGLKALQLADSDSLQVGQRVVAIGNHFGLSFSVSEGIISALNRPGLSGFNEYIQTDVTLNPGNSGGPLIDTAGKVIGINNFKVSNAEGLGFALESNSIREVINRLAGRDIIE